MQDIYIPLFVNFVDPIAIYIIDNELIGCNEYGFRDRLPNRAFELLHELFSSPIGKKGFPSSLSKHFQINPFPQLLFPEKCLTGEENYFGGLVFCLDLNLYFRAEKPLPILFHNVTFEGVPLGYEIELSPCDAFLILSNICIDHAVESFQAYTKNSEKKEYSRALLPQKIFTFHKLTTLYAVDYLDHICSCLREGLLTPLELLRTGGQNILVLLSSLEPVESFIDQMLDRLQTPSSLSTNYKNVYYTFLKVLSDSGLLIYPKIKRFYDDNAHLIRQLKTEIERPFPGKKKFQE